MEMTCSEFFSIKFMDNNVPNIQSVKKVLDILSNKKVLLSVTTDTTNAMQMVVFAKYVVPMDVSKILISFPDAIVSYGDAAVDDYLGFLDDFLNQ